jgi:hypothetical protein
VRSRIERPKPLSPVNAERKEPGAGLGTGAGSGEDVHIRGVGALSADERKDELWAKHSSSKGVSMVGTGVEEETGGDFGAGAKETERRKKGSNSPLRPKPRPTEVTEVELREDEPGAS